MENLEKTNPMRKINRLMLTLLLAGMASPVFQAVAQAPLTRKDSLFARLRLSAEDTNQVMRYLKYGEFYELSQPDSATYYYMKARDLARKLNYARGEATFVSYYIVVLNNQGNYQEALNLCQEAVKIFTRIGSQKEIAIAYNNVGNEWEYLGDLKQAVQNYLKALQIMDKLQLKFYRRMFSNNVASVFLKLGDFKKGYQYAAESLEIAREINDRYAVASSLINVGTAEASLRRYKDALRHFREVAAIGKEIDDYTLVLDGLLNEADVYNRTKQFTAAAPRLRQALTLAQQNQNPAYEFTIYRSLATTMTESGRLTEAQTSVRQALHIARQLNAANEVREMLVTASEIEEKVGNFAPALAYRKQFEKLNDSLLAESNTVAINQLEAQYQSEKKEARIRQLSQEKEIQALSIRQKNTLNYVFVGAIIALLAGGLLAYRNYRNQRLITRQTQALQSQRIRELEQDRQLVAVNSVLQGQEEERSRLAKDLHDGLGGMLSGIKLALMHMKGNVILPEENASAFSRTLERLDDSIQELRRIARNMMPETLIRFGLKDALTDYCGSLQQSTKLPITCQTFGLENRIEQSVEIIIYRIIQELLNNVVKHAQATQAVVQIVKETTRLSLTVEDNGKGFDFRPATRATGIGLSNIQSRIAYLNGTLDIQSRPASGTSVHIDIPLQP